jgi:hypothetical protein
MRSASLALTLAGLTAAFLLTEPSTAAETLRRPLTARVWETDLAADSVRFHLPDGWVIPGSVLAVVDRETLRAGTDYELEPAEGVIRLLRARQAGHLRIRYEVVPLAIGRVFQRPIPLDTARTEITPIAPRQDRMREVTSRARLDLRGTKTVSLEVGSAEDLTLRQSLDVSISGTIVPGVSVRGVLSDRQTPLQPEGSTTELSDVDRVYLQIDGPGASMTLGDFSLRGPPGLFTGYQRQLEGISLRGSRGTVHGNVAAATVPGEFRTVEFLAIEGKQGPYPLLVNQGSLEGVIQAGSERVWVDGEPLVRGEDRDYVIDYAAGTLSFTGRRVVGKDSRVTVDFQTSANPYRRNAYAAEFGLGVVDEGKEGTQGFGLRTGFFMERDDPSHPAGGSLSEEERDALEQAGDSLTADLAPGIDCRTDGYGDYEWVEADSLAFPFLRYAGPDSGTCRVRFVEVGDRKGDYVDSLLSGGTTIYRFVGLRRGRFLPGRAVARPGERGVLDLLSTWSGPSGLRLEGEGAVSLDDPNVLSSKDDADREGGALHILLARDTLPLRLGTMAMGRWGLRLESRDVEPTFRASSRTDPGWYGYDWGIAEGRLDNGNSRRSATLRQEPGSGFALEGSYETLSNLKDLKGERNRLIVRRTGRLQGRLDRMRAATTDRAGEEPVDGLRSIDNATIGLQLRRVEGTVGYQRDRQESESESVRSGGGFDEWRASAAYLIPSDRGRIEFGQVNRQDRQILGGRWQAGGRARTWEGRCLWTPPGRLLDGHFARRDLLPRDGGTVRSDIAGLIWSEDRGDGRFGQQVRADLNTTEEAARIKSIEYVGEGQGHYDSLGVYVGVGDYDVLLIPTGASNLLRKFDATWRLDAAPGRGKDGTAGTSLPARLWQSSQWLLQATFSSRTTGSASAFWQDLPQLLLAHRRGVPLAQNRIRAEASALPQARWLSPQVRIERGRSEAQGTLNTQTQRLNDAFSVALRSSPGKRWTLEQEAQIDREEEKTRLLGSNPTSGRQGWHSGRLRLSESWRPGIGWVFRLGSIGRVRDRLPGGHRYQVIQMIPGIQWLPRERSRIDMQVTRTWVEGPSGRILGLEQPGWDGRGSFGIRLRRWLDASAVVDFHAPENGTKRTSGQAEMKAYF